MNREHALDGAAAVTLPAATRLPLLPTVLIGIAATGALRHLLGQ